MKNEATGSRDEQIRKVADLIGEVTFAMLTTVEPDGTLRSRPMAVQQSEFDGDLWFFTRDDSAKVEEVRREQRVNVAFAKPSDQTYVSISGRATVVDDRQKAEELWSPAYKAWFPDGLDDPHLTLLKVEVDQAEYWDSPSSVIVYAIGLAKAVLQGTSYPDAASSSEHERVDL